VADCVISLRANNNSCVFTNGPQVCMSVAVDTNSMSALRLASVCVGVTVFVCGLACVCGDADAVLLLVSVWANATAHDINKHTHRVSDNCTDGS
jgi:hypothetical protein